MSRWRRGSIVIAVDPPGESKWIAHDTIVGGVRRGRRERQALSFGRLAGTLIDVMVGGRLPMMTPESPTVCPEAGSVSLS